MVSVGAFDRLERKVELIRGELIEMNPAGPIHDDLITYLTIVGLHAAPISSMSIDHIANRTGSTGNPIPT